MFENVEIVDDSNANDVVEEASDVPRRKYKLKSPVWKGFDRIFNDDGSISAKCRHCKRLFVGGGRSGTTPLRNHLERCPCKTIDPAPLQSASEAPSINNDKLDASSKFRRGQMTQSAPSSLQAPSKGHTRHQDKSGSFERFCERQMADFQKFQLQQMTEFQQFQQKQMASFQEFYQ